MPNSQITPSIQADCLQTFLFETSLVRGEIVRLHEAWKTIQERRMYPYVINRHLGEMVAAGALLSATLKFDGTLILQAQGTGPVRLLVVECTADLKVRATIKLNPAIDSDAIPPNASLADLINPDGKGMLVITLDPSKQQEGQQAYQGIVPLIDGDKPINTIAEAIMVYMRNSEQLQTRVWLACNDDYCAGILLQRLPKLGGKSLDLSKTDDELSEDWSRLQMLADTTSNDELLNTPPETMMRRLFQEESAWQGVRSFPMRSVAFDCQCSRKRVGNMLLMLGIAEVESILAEQGQVETECDFCGQRYHFDPVDCAQLFKANNANEGLRPAEGKH